MYWNSNGVGWGGWLVMGLVMITFLAVVIAAIVITVRATSNPETRDTGRRPARSSSAIGILEERFARGEIDEKALADGRRALSGTSGVT